MPKRKIDIEKLKKAIKDNPDANIIDLAKKFDCSFQSISMAIQRHNIQYNSKQEKHSKR